MSYLDHFPKIKALIFDVDGVLTNGQIVLLPDGHQMRQMHSKDGYALQMAVKKGYIVGIITGGKSIQVKERLTALGITDIHLGTLHKDEALDDIINDYSISKEEVMYMGDDIPDLCVLTQVGLAACPTDAALEVKNVSQYVSSIQGGSGCVRDIIEKIMRSQGKWYDQEENPDNFAEFTW